MRDGTESKRHLPLIFFEKMIDRFVLFEYNVLVQ